MNLPRTPRARGLAVLACLIGAATPLTVFAQPQQAPLTGQMLTPPAATDRQGPADGGAAPRPPATPPAVPAPAQPPAGVAYPAAAATYAPAPAITLPPRAGIGETTRAVLQLQAAGTHAGPRLPILGDQAAASYQRYLKSFEHEIPEYLETSVRKDAASPNSGG